MKRKLTRVAISYFVLCFIFLSTHEALCGAAQLDIQYTVKVADVSEQLFHVTTRIGNIHQQQLNISLPVWTPGWYTVENYAKNILRFKVIDARGASLPFHLKLKQTWTVDTDGRDQIQIDFDYRANVLALNQAKIAKDYAFFTGTQLFLMPEGHRMDPSTVRFEAPSGWNIISALQSTSDPLTFTATDYDTLVDSPTELGNFDVTSFDVNGKPHYFVATPAGAFPKDKAAEFTRMLAKVAGVQSAIFGGLPFDKYVYYYFFTGPESNAGGALEHANSQVSFAPPADFASPERMIGNAAHEFFHLWNVKRIRPVEMWPYDYARENETPLLWVSEGFTNYYEEVSVRRAGLEKPAQFLESVIDTINRVENNQARAYISPATASVSTWLCYDTPCAFQISYYTQGQNLAALLDLSILHDTQGDAGLDDVMRTLYREYYQKGRGYSTGDLVAVINRVARRDYHDFFRRYVEGTEVPPYGEIFGYAGYRDEKFTRRVPVLGFRLNNTPEGLRITSLKPDSPGFQAGLQTGDLLLAVDEIKVEQGGRDIFRRFGERADKTVNLTVRRAGKNMSVEMKVGSRAEEAHKIVEMSNPNGTQLKVRAGWLK